MRAKKQALPRPCFICDKDWLFAVPEEMFETQLFDAVFGF
jgi:hypothetical protein